MAVLSAAVTLTRAVSREDPKSWSLEQWSTWRDQQIRAILEPTGPNGSLVRDTVAQRCVEASQTIRRALSDDPGYFARNDRLSREMDHFERFVLFQGLTALRDHRYGTMVSDKDYWAMASADARIPALLKSQEFLDSLSTPTTYRKALELVKDHNRDLAPARKWRVVLFRSQFIRSVDRVTYGRMLVVVPNEPTSDGGAIDRWVQFGISTPDMDLTSHPRSISVVSVRRWVDRSRPPTCSLVDYLRNTDRTTGAVSIIPTALAEDDPSTACFSCHKTGVIPIHPKVEYGFGSDGGLVPLPVGSPSPAEQVNRLVREYGKTDLLAVDPDAAGPSIGHSATTITDDLVRQANPGSMLSRESIARINASLNCGRCHDLTEKINYPLSLPTDSDWHAFESGKGLVQTYVESGWMPPGNTLSGMERIALWNCLRKNYFDPASGSGTLVDWLKGGP